MTSPTIHGGRAVFSASNLLEAAGKAIGEIKQQDRLTWADVGAVLGVSDDQASKYADGTATMNFVTFYRGKHYWNGRFTGPCDRICEESRPGKVNDHGSLTAVLNAAACLSKALEDGSIKAAEVRDNRSELEAAYDALGAQLAKLGPVGERA